MKSDNDIIMQSVTDKLTNAFEILHRNNYVVCEASLEPECMYIMFDNVYEFECLPKGFKKQYSVRVPSNINDFRKKDGIRTICLLVYDNDSVIPIKDLELIAEDVSDWVMDICV